MEQEGMCSRVAARNWKYVITTVLIDCIDRRLVELHLDIH